MSPNELQNLLNTSNSYKEVLDKVGLTSIGNNYKTLRKYIDEYKLTTEILDENRRKNSFGKKIYSKDTFIDDLNSGTVIRKGSFILRKLIEFGLKEYKCEICGINEWMGLPLVLELHHKDGDNQNCKYDNLQIVCPNCHSQTDNFRYKNINSKESKKCRKCGKPIKSSSTELCYECNMESRRKICYVHQTHPKKLCPICNINKINKESNSCFDCYIKLKIHGPKISREELKNKIRKHSFIELSHMYNVDVKTIRRWFNKYSLPTRKSVINAYNDEEWAQV